MTLETAKALNWQDNRQCRGRYETTEPRFNDQVHVVAPQNFNSAMIPAIDIGLDTIYSCVRIFYHVIMKIIINDHGNCIDIKIYTFTEINAAKSLILNSINIIFLWVFLHFAPARFVHDLCLLRKPHGRTISIEFVRLVTWQQPQIKF